MPNDTTLTEPKTDRQQALDARQRRLDRALGDLGVLPLVGPGWARISDLGVTFRALDDDSGDRLVRALEILALGEEPAPVVPARGQLVLDLEYSFLAAPSAHGWAA